MAERLLLVEDRENLREMLAKVLSEGFIVDAVGDGAEAIRRLAEERFAVVVTDVRLPGASGIDVLAAARSKEPPPEVVLMTAYAAVPDAVAALRAGAYDYLAKPFDPPDLLRAAYRAAERHALLSRTRALEEAVSANDGALIGGSPGMQAAMRLVERVAPLPIPVLLLGESGTGKEVVAREIHRLRGSGELVAVNCGAIPENLLESELFGVAKGAYTGAGAGRPGLVEQAAGGTLLLDEVGELPMGLQVKLNRLLEEGEFRRVGEAETRHSSARILAATHRDPERMVAEGTFRADLFFRLKVVVISLPPLRERREDIPLFAARFLHLASARYGTTARRLSPDALAAIEGAAWPGNLRELRHALEHAAVMAEGDLIEVRHLPPELRELAPRAPAGSYREAMDQAAEQAGRDYLVALLRRESGNVTRAATEAGVERESMHRLLRRHGIDPTRFR